MIKPATRIDLSLNIVVLLVALIASFTTGVWLAVIALVIGAIAATFGPATASFYLAGRSPGAVLAGGLATGVVGCGLFGLMVTRTTLGKVFIPVPAILRADPLHWAGAAHDPAIRFAETLALACWDSVLIGLPFALAGLIVCVPVALRLDRR